MKAFFKAFVVFIGLLLIGSMIAIPLIILQLDREEPPSPNPSQNLQVWFEGSMVRLSRDAVSNNNTAFHLYAAKGEYESFQIVVKPIHGNLKNVHIEISDFISESASISKSNVDFFYEHYIEVTEPTPWFQSYPPKWYPDALIPFYHPDTGKDIVGAKYDGYPFDVKEGECQPIWVDVFVPRNAQTGNYDATISVNCTDHLNLTASRSFKVSLTVWDFTLPLKPSLQSTFQISYGYLYQGHNVQSQPFKDQFWKELMANYKKEIFKHRTTPNGITYFMPQPLANGTPNWANGAEVLFHSELQTWIEEYHATSVDFYYIPYDDIPGEDHDKTINYVGGIYSYLKQFNWEDLLFIYVDDEPNSLEDYQRVRAISSTLKEIDEDIRLFVTEQFEPQESEWGTLVGYVNLWCPQWGFITRDEVIARQATGDEVWLYGFPYLDYPIVTHRKLAWRLEHFNLTGYQMFCVNNWYDVNNYDPWTETANLYDGQNRPYNKNGELFYPGTQAGLPLHPVSSIRYKVIRESIEDYDYFQLLKQCGKKDLCKTIVDLIINDWDDPDGWLTDSEEILSLRVTMAQEILNKSIKAPIESIQEDSWQNIKNTFSHKIIHGIAATSPLPYRRLHIGRRGTPYPIVLGEDKTKFFCSSLTKKKKSLLNCLSINSRSD